MKTILAVFLVLTIVSFSQAALFPSQLKEEILSNDSASVIVILKFSILKTETFQAKEKEMSQVQEQVLSTLTESDFKLRYKYQTIPCFSGVLTQSGLEKLSQNPQVAYIQLVQRASGSLAESVPTIKADSAHFLGYTGKGCVVGVLDSGIDSLHWDLSDALIAQRHYLGGGTDTGDGAWDDHGHGTNVTGIIASNGIVSPVGVAPDVKIVAVKVLGSDNYGDFSDILKGLDWIVSNNDSLSVDFINMSLGGGLFTGTCDDYDPAMKLAIDACRAAGIVVFAASHNQGSITEMSSPACLSNCVAVGAVYDSDLGREPDGGTYYSIFGGSWPACYDNSATSSVITCFTNRNSELDLLAPGAWIRSDAPGNHTSTYAGTSQASPHCAGLAALLYEMNPNLSSDSIYNIIKNTGIDVFDPATGLTFKRIDALAAITGDFAIPFSEAVNYLIGSQPYSVFATDLDADTDKDLIAANNGSNTVSVLKNNSNSTFAGKVDYATGRWPTSVISSDLDGDGYQDLVTANEGSSTVSILKNYGNGTFAVKVDYATGTYPRAVFAANLDGDSDEDLAVANYGSNSISVLNNNGDGTFATKVDYATGIQPHSVFAADLDGDTFKDLIVANYGSNTVSILSNNSDGTFADKVDYESGNRPRAVIASDLDGDGDQDLAVVNVVSASVSVLKNNGDGTFAARIDYPTGSSPYSISVSDLDQDTDQDLVIANYTSNTISVLKNNGDATFRARIGPRTGPLPSSVFASDLDQDGDPDLAVTNYNSNTVSVIKNQLIICEPSIMVADLNADGKRSIPDLIILLNYLFKNQPLPSGTNPCAADLNADGRISPSDLVTLINNIFKARPLPFEVCGC